MSNIAGRKRLRRRKSSWECTAPAHFW